MEPAPLIQAHAHARAAFSHQAQLSDISTACEEHALAAGEFAQAAKGTGDAEALRTLRLLEQHHRQLHKILKFRSSHPNPAQATTEDHVPTKEAGITAAPLTDSGPTSKPVRTEDAMSSGEKPSPAARSLSNPGRARDLTTSSIATDLASARGIPASSRRRRAAPVSPTVSVEHAGGKMSVIPASTFTTNHRGGRGRRDSSQLPKKDGLPTPAKGTPNAPSSRPCSSHPSSASNPTPSPEPDPDPDPDSFTRFYSTFESLLSRLSAPLAFAGLPLAAEPPKTPEFFTSTTPPSNAVTTTAITTAATTSRQPTVPPDQVDLSRLFSRAALRAVHPGPLSAASVAAESFYVVPSTGGTISYAGILSRAEAERFTSGGSVISEEDEFVDAREAPSTTSSPNLRRQPPKQVNDKSSGASRPNAARAPNPKTMEELQLENAALRQLSDGLSKRLHMWEVNAQSSSLALQQSLRNMQRTGSHRSASNEGDGQPDDDCTRPPSNNTRDRRQSREREHELEERLAASEREIAKLREVIARYRAKWEKLKEGARARRERGEDGGRLAEE